MIIIKNLIARLFFPKAFKFTHSLKDAFIESVCETLKFDPPVKELCANWLSMSPHTYFTELFLENEEWSIPFVSAFEQSKMTDAQHCYIITQAFFLRHLFQLITQDEEYKNYSREAITHNILSHMSFGTEILSISADFEKVLNNIISFFDDFSMCYVEKIVEIQYPTRNTRDSILASIRFDSVMTIIALEAFTLESIKSAKRTDRQLVL